MLEKNYENTGARAEHTNQADVRKSLRSNKGYQNVIEKVDARPGSERPHAGLVYWDKIKTKDIGWTIKDSLSERSSHRRKPQQQSDHGGMTVVFA